MSWLDARTARPEGNVAGSASNESKKKIVQVRAGGNFLCGRRLSP